MREVKPAPPLRSGRSAVSLRPSDRLRHEARRMCGPPARVTGPHGRTAGPGGLFGRSMWADDGPRWIRLPPKWADDSAMWADDRPRWIRLRPRWADDKSMWAEGRPMWAEHQIGRIHDAFRPVDRRRGRVDIPRRASPVRSGSPRPGVYGKPCASVEARAGLFRPQRSSRLIRTKSTRLCVGQRDPAL